MLEIKGINRKTGEYQGTPFDYCQFFGINEKGDWEMVKVKTKVLIDSGFKEPTALKSNKVEILYNKFGQVESVRISNK